LANWCATDFGGEKRNTSKLSVRVRFAVTHDAEGFNKGLNSPVKIKKQTLFLRANQ